jgi:hypothetical protein
LSIDLKIAQTPDILVGLDGKFRPHYIKWSNFTLENQLAVAIFSNNLDFIGVMTGLLGTSVEKNPKIFEVPNFSEKRAITKGELLRNPNIILGWFLD